MPLLSDDQITSALRRFPAGRAKATPSGRRLPLQAFPRPWPSWRGSSPGAEAADHHPDLTINYRRVTVAYTTHSAGGLTEKDVAGARMAEEQSGRV